MSFNQLSVGLQIETCLKHIFNHSFVKLKTSVVLFAHDDHKRTVQNSSYQSLECYVARLLLNLISDYHLISHSVDTVFVYILVRTMHS